MSANPNLMRELVVQEISTHQLNTQNTHSKQSENSAALIVKRLHQRYLPDLTEAQMHTGVEDLLKCWVDELIHYEILTRDSQQTKEFLASLQKLAIYKNDGWDAVQLSEGRELCRLWEVLWCLIHALRDEERFENPAFTYRERLSVLYKKMVDALKENAGLDGGFCNTGVRNDFVSVLNHEYVEDDGETVYVLTSLTFEVHHQVQLYYEKKLSRTLSSDRESDRRLAFRVIRQWLNVQFDKPNVSTSELDEFRGDITSLRDHVEAFFEKACHIPRSDPNVTRHLDQTIALLESFACPMPTVFRQTFLALSEMTEHPDRFENHLHESLQSCLEMRDVTRFIEVVRRAQLLEKVKPYARILAVGEEEGRLKALALRIQNDLLALSTNMESDALLIAIKNLDVELSTMIDTTRRESTTDILRDSFALIKTHQERHEFSPHEFREIVFQLLARPEFNISEPALRKTLETLAHEEDGYTVLDLTPVSVNSIVWFAIRVSPAEWSPDFQTVIRQLLVELNKPTQDRNRALWNESSYADIIGQLAWMLACAEDKKWLAPFSPIYIPCNLAGLEIDVDTIKNNDDLERQFVRPLSHYSWWLGLPAQWTVADLPHLSHETLTKIWSLCHEDQLLREFDRALPVFEKHPDFQMIIPLGTLPIMAQIEVVFRHWNKISIDNLQMVLMHYQACGRVLDAALLERFSAKITTFAQFHHIYRLLGQSAIKPVFFNRHIDCLANHADRIEFLKNSTYLPEFTALMERFLDVDLSPSDYVKEVIKPDRSEARVIVDAIRLKKLLERCPQNENALAYLQRCGEVQLLRMNLTEDNYGSRRAKIILAAEAIKKLNCEQARLYCRTEDLIAEFDVVCIDDKETKFLESLESLRTLQNMLKSLQFDPDLLDECERVCRRARRSFEADADVEKLLKKSLTTRKPCLAGFLSGDSSQDDYHAMMRAFHRTPMMNRFELMVLKIRLPTDTDQKFSISQYGFQRVLCHVFQLPPSQWSDTLLYIIDRVFACSTPWLKAEKHEILKNQIAFMMARSKSVSLAALSIPFLLPCRLDGIDVVSVPRISTTRNDFDAKLIANITYYFDWFALPTELALYIPEILGRSHVPLLLALERAIPKERMAIVVQYFQYTNMSLPVVEAIKTRLPKDQHEEMNTLWLHYSEENERINQSMIQVVGNALTY